MAAGEDALVILKLIDAKLGAIVALLAGGGVSTTGAAQAGPTTASDADLDGQYGDPEVKAKSPRDWTGPSMQGRTFSQCPPEYLDQVAARLDYFAEQNGASEDADTRKKATYNRKDAARARGWAARIRAGVVTQAPMPEPEAPPMMAEDISF